MRPSLGLTSPQHEMTGGLFYGEAGGRKRLGSGVFIGTTTSTLAAASSAVEPRQTFDERVEFVSRYNNFSAPNHERGSDLDTRVAKLLVQ